MAQGDEKPEAKISYEGPLHIFTFRSRDNFPLTWILLGKKDGGKNKDKRYE
jgi:hypothetical protein